MTPQCTQKAWPGRRGEESRPDIVCELERYGEEAVSKGMNAIYMDLVHMQDSGYHGCSGEGLYFFVDNAQLLRRNKLSGICNGMSRKARLAFSSSTLSHRSSLFCSSACCCLSSTPITHHSSAPLLAVAFLQLPSLITLLLSSTCCCLSHLPSLNSHTIWSTLLSSSHTIWSPLLSIPLQLTHYLVSAHTHYHPSDVKDLGDCQLNCPVWTPSAMTLHPL